MNDQAPPGDRPPVKGDLFDEGPTDLVAYLRRYRDKYTREAMAARLIEAGHEVDAVERALAELESSAPAAASADEHERARLVARVIVGIAFAGLLLGLLSIAPQGPGATGYLVAALALTALFGGGAIWWLGRVKGTGGMAAIAVVAVFLGLPATFFGACFAYFSSGGTFL